MMCFFSQPFDLKDPGEEASTFSLSHNILYTIKKKKHHLSHIEIDVCKCSQFGQAKFFLFDKMLRPCKPITKQQNFGLVQIETHCRQHFKVHL